MNFMFLLWLLIAYIFGSINNAVLVSKLIYKKDIREYGSKNSGSTNVLRTFGKGTALIVFILDILKPVIPIILCNIFTPHAYDTIIGGVAWLGVFAILGQCYPVFFGFRGGKGAASTLGTMLALFPLTVPLAAVIFLGIIFTINIVSVATLVAILLNTIQVYILYPQYILPYITIVVIIFWRHRANIQRIIHKEEPRLKDNKKKTSVHKD